MKHFIALGSVMWLLAAFPASADVSIGLSFAPSEPTFVEPAPVYEMPGYVEAPAYPDYYRHRHYHHRPRRHERRR